MYGNDIDKRVVGVAKDEDGDAGVPEKNEETVQTLNARIMITKQEALDLVSADLRDRDGAEIIALVRPWSDVLNRFEWNKTTETFQLNDEAFHELLDGLSKEEANRAAHKREWNETVPEKYQEFVRVLIQGIVRRPDGELDYESAGFRDAQDWCRAHEQEMMGWDLEQPGDMEWGWLGHIYDFWPLFRSGSEFDAYFCFVFQVRSEDKDNYWLTQDRDLLTAVGLNPDTDRHRCLDFLLKYTIRMGPFFERR